MIKEKISTLDEQIRFIQDARKLLENGADEVLFLPDTTNVLRSIEENLNTIKMWISLPEYHQAAMHILDMAFEMEHGAKLLRDQQFGAEDYRQIIAHNLLHGDPEEKFEAVAAIGMIAVAKFCMVKKAQPSELAVLTQAHVELEKLKGWWSRTQMSILDDDYHDVCEIIRNKVLALHKDNPDLMTDEDLLHFNLRAEEVSNG